MAKRIRFKSTPENFRKECIGIKNNTIRTFKEKGDERQEILDDFINGKWTFVDVYIENSVTGEEFGIEVVDVTKYMEWYIISWKVN